MRFSLAEALRPRRLEMTDEDHAIWVRRGPPWLQGRYIATHRVDYQTFRLGEHFGARELVRALKEGER